MERHVVTAEAKDSGRFNFSNKSWYPKTHFNALQTYIPWYSVIKNYTVFFIQHTI